MVHMTDDEIQEYREKKAKEKKRAEEKAAKTEAAKTQARREQARQQLEPRVKTAFLDAGGTKREFTRMKGTLVEAALVAEATRPVEASAEPEKPRVDPPLTRRQYMDR